MKTSNHVLENIWKVLIIVSSVIFFLGALLTAFNVFLRKAFNSPWIGTEETCSILLVILVFLPLAYVEWNKKQLTVSVLFDLMPKRIQYWLWKLQHLVILVVTSYLTVAAWDVMQRNMDTGNKTAALGIPMYMLYLILVVGLGLTALTKVIQVVMLKEEAEIHAD